VGELHLSENFNSDWNVDQKERKLFKVFVILGLVDDFVQVVQILLSLVTSGQLVESADNVLDFGFSLLD